MTLIWCALILVYKSLKKSKNIKGPVPARLLLKLVNYLTHKTLQPPAKNFKNGVHHTEYTTFIKIFKMIPVIYSIKNIPKNSPDLFTEMKSVLQFTIRFRFAQDLGDSAEEVQKLLNSVIYMKKIVDKLEKNFFFETLCDFVNLVKSRNFAFCEDKAVLSPRKKGRKYRNSKQRQSSLFALIEPAAEENVSGKSLQEDS